MRVEDLLDPDEADAVAAGLAARARRQQETDALARFSAAGLAQTRPAVYLTSAHVIAALREQGRVR